MSKKSIITRLQSSVSRSFGAVLVFSGLCSLQAVGQGLGNTPYSTYGIGERFSDAFAAQQMMGGSGVSYANGLFINNINPALIARNRITTLEVGTLIQSKQLKEGNLQQNVVGGNLNYLAMAFPINSRWTSSLNYTPYSYLDYNNRRVSTIPGDMFSSLTEYRGSGGMNKVSFVNGVRVYKNLYAGISASYLFGTLTREVSTQTLRGDGNDYTLLFTDTDQNRNFLFKGGLAYRFKFSDKRYLNVGGTYELPTQLRTSRVSTQSALVGEIPVAGSNDTLSYNGSGRVNLPGSYRIGLSYENPYRLAVTADFSMQQWSQFRDFNRSNQNMQDSYQVSAGLEYTPNIVSSTYWNRIPYRFGVNFSQLPYSVRGQRINEASLSIGMGLPLTKVGLSDANLGLTVGQRGKEGTGIIKEQFFRINLGFTISDQWFYRQVVD
ncbi:hypothetical protein BWI93_24575 [Siphonobacter sp. BAB-5385]|uniref:hypothetical protein n=1 Tax=unclassified Siphonobacter TaxID=2635712 RepID=UPI000B9ECF5D|nr:MULTISPECIES: hypothetical protein [unclassified Siphonobacter]OZI05610.1 hypothetical protein BWI93_24575 [Siphonobacter sp. BAB-5385]PMD98546.1 hypothetical protein BWI97_05150 [Siphonobacter sp. BAB-5405]